jgi:hypothetical protein
VLMKRPSAVVDLRAESSDGAVMLTWDPPLDDGGDPISGYALYLASDSGDLVYLITVQSIEFRAEGLENGRTYRYSVAALNSMGMSDATATVVATPRGLPGAPGALTAVPSNGLVRLHWDAPSQNGGYPITGYRIYVLQEGSYVCVATPEADANSFVCTGLANGLEYRFCIAALNTVGEGEMSLPAATTPFSGQSAEVSGGTPSSSLLGGSMMMIMLVAFISVAVILFVGYQHATRKASKSSHVQRRSEEDADKDMEEAVQNTKLEARARYAVLTKGGKVDTAFEASLRELEELER